MQRQNLDATLESGKRTLQLAEDSRKLMYDAEEKGSSTLEQMQSQNEQLRGAQDQVKEISTFTETAAYILERMKSRAMRQKIILSVLILILLALNGVVLYYGFIKDKNSDDDK